MERKGMFTRGPVWDESGVIHAKGPKWTEDNHSCIHPVNVETEADGALVVSAFNAATACEDMGYNGEECVKELPELVEGLEWMVEHSTSKTVRSICANLLIKCRG